MEKQNEVIKHSINFISPPTTIKASLVICLWNMEHLMWRSAETYCKQDFPKENWELIIVSDNSLGDIGPIIDIIDGKINYQYFDVKHSFGMRGNTAAFNLGFSHSNGSILMESTAETMFTPDLVRKLYEPHLIHERAFVAAKTYNLKVDQQIIIDSCNWREDVSNIMLLDGFFNDWTLNNFRTLHFGTHQTCSIKKSLFYELFPLGFPLYGDYGSEDPRYSGVRSQNGVKDITIMQPMAFHQWHPSYQYWMAKGLAPHANKFGHSTSNYLLDRSGDVPAGGTCMIWDKGSHERLSEAEVAEWNTLDEKVRATGCKIV